MKKIAALIFLFTFCVNYSQTLEISEYFPKNNPEKMLKDITQKNLSYEENKNDTLLVIYNQIEPLSLLGIPITDSKISVINGKPYALIGTIEKFDKDISDDPLFGLKAEKEYQKRLDEIPVFGDSLVVQTADAAYLPENEVIADSAYAYTPEIPNTHTGTDSLSTAEDFYYDNISFEPSAEYKAAEEEYIRKYRKFLADSSVKTQQLYDLLNKHFPLLEDNTDCNFSCISAWKIPSGKIIVERNNFIDKINGRQELFIDTVLLLIFDNADLPYFFP